MAEAKSAACVEVYDAKVVVPRTVDVEAAYEVIAVASAAALVVTLRAAAVVVIDSASSGSQ